MDLNTIRSAAGLGEGSKENRKFLCDILSGIDEDALHFLLGAIEYEVKHRRSEERNPLAEADGWAMVRNYHLSFR